MLSMIFVAAAKDGSNSVGLDSKEEHEFRVSLPLELIWNVLLFLSSASLASLRSTCRASRDEWCAGTGWDLAWWRPRFCRTFLGTLLAMSGGSGGEDFECESWEQLYNRLDNIRAVRWKECTSESEKDRLVQARSVPYKFVVDEMGSRILRVGGKASFQRREPQTDTFLTCTRCCNPSRAHGTVLLQGFLRRHCVCEHATCKIRRRRRGE